MLCVKRVEIELKGKLDIIHTKMSSIIMLSAINIMLVIASQTSIAVEAFASSSPARAPIRHAMLYNAISTSAASVRNGTRRLKLQ